MIDSTKENPSFNIYKKAKMNIKNQFSNCKDEIIDELNFYCLDCDLSTCNKCSLREHINHQIINKYKYYKLDNTIINDHFKLLNEALNSDIITPDKIKQNITNQITKEIDLLITELTELKNNKIKEVNQLFNESNTDIDVLKNNISQIKEKIYNFFKENKQFFYINLNGNEEMNNNSNNNINNSNNSNNNININIGLNNESTNNSKINVCAYNSNNTSGLNGVTFNDNNPYIKKNNNDYANIIFLIIYDILNKSTIQNNLIIKDLNQIKEISSNYSNSINDILSKLKYEINKLKNEFNSTLKNNNNKNIDFLCYDKLKTNYYSSVKSTLESYNINLNQIKETIYNTYNSNKYNIIDRRTQLLECNKKFNISTILNNNKNINESINENDNENNQEKNDNNKDTFSKSNYKNRRKIRTVSYELCKSRQKSKKNFSMNNSDFIDKEKTNMNLLKNNSCKMLPNSKRNINKIKNDYFYNSNSNSKVFIPSKAAVSSNESNVIGENNNNNNNNNNICSVSNFNDDSNTKSMINSTNYYIKFNNANNVMLITGKLQKFFAFETFEYLRRLHQTSKTELEYKENDNEIRTTNSNNMSNNLNKSNSKNNTNPNLQKPKNNNNNNNNEQIKHFPESNLLRSKQMKKGITSSATKSSKILKRPTSQPSIPSYQSVSSNTLSNQSQIDTIINRLQRPFIDIFSKNLNNSVSSQCQIDEKDMIKPLICTNEIQIYDKKTKKIYKKQVDIGKTTQNSINKFLPGCRFIIVKKKLFISGGCTSNVNQGKLFLSYDLTTNQLSKLKDLPNPHAYHTMEYLDIYSSILIIGGEKNNYVELYDISTNKFTVLPQLNFTRSNLSVFLDKKRHWLYACFGVEKYLSGDRFVYSDVIEKLDLTNVSNGWVRVCYQNNAEMNLRAYAVHIFPLDNERILVFGYMGIKVNCFKMAVLMLGGDDRDKTELIKVDKGIMEEVRILSKKSAKLSQLLDSYN